jgi:hypothetical protein
VKASEMPPSAASLSEGTATIVELLAARCPAAVAGEKANAPIREAQQ